MSGHTLPGLESITTRTVSIFAQRNPDAMREVADVFRSVVAAVYGSEECVEDDGPFVERTAVRLCLGADGLPVVREGGAFLALDPKVAASVCVTVVPGLEAGAFNLRATVYTRCSGSIYHHKTNSTTDAPRADTIYIPRESATQGLTELLFNLTQEIQRTYGDSSHGAY